jgi:glutathione S-transferase
MEGGMKLYYSPGACSQAPHILLHEIGLAHDAARVDLKTKMVEDGRSYLQVNPKGSVPALELDNGEVLTENAVVLQYLGDRAGSDVLPALGSFRRYRVLEMVNFITTELHKSFSPLFNRDAGDEIKRFFREQLRRKLDYVDDKIGQGLFALGETLTIADPYLFVMTRWTDAMLGLDNWRNLAAFRERMLERPSVRHVLRFEGLLKEEVAG